MLRVEAITELYGAGGGAVGELGVIFDDGDDVGDLSVSNGFVNLQNIEFESEEMVAYGKISWRNLASERRNDRVADTDMVENIVHAGDGRSVAVEAFGGYALNLERFA